MDEEISAPGLSKNARKKQEKALYKQEMKREHHNWEHSAKLVDARRLHARLAADIERAVPEAALYAQLPRDSAQELFAAVGDEMLRSSVFFQRPQNSSQEAGAGAGAGAGAVGSGAAGAGGAAGATGTIRDGGDGTDGPDGAAALIASDGGTAAAADDGDDDPGSARACRVIDQFMWRAHKYNEKYASQELSLLYQIFRLGGTTGCDLVIDVGAGNANLSCLIALVFDVPVICVEMDSPRPELRGESWLPADLKQRKAVTRVERLIQDYVLPDGYENVIVLGKHLCGPGTDAGIEFVRKHLDRMLGCVFATCCCCKLVGGPGAGVGGATLFADLYFPRGGSGGGGGSSDAGVDPTAPTCEPCEPGEPPPPTPESEAAADVDEQSLIEREASRAGKEAAGRKEAARALDHARLAAAKDEARRLGKQLCRRYLRYGMCDDGEACRFHHCTEAPKAIAEEEEQGAGHALFRRYRFAKPPPSEEEGGGSGGGDGGDGDGGNGGGGGDRGARDKGGEAFVREVLPTVARATSWRNQLFNARARGTLSSAYGELLNEATYFESWIQGFRRRRLRELFGAEEEVLYCADDVHSQQNRCLVSGRLLRPCPSGGATASYVAFFRLLEQQFVKYEASLPMDLRVRGLVSAKFGYDGSKLPWDPAMAVS